jgi:ketosteroid isomerase-like protein
VNPGPVQIEQQIRDMVNRETEAWNSQNADALLSLFHPDMVWPWPPDNHSHDPANWVMVLGRFDRERWKKVWQGLFDTHQLIHNRREIHHIKVSDQGDGAFAVVDVDTLWRDRDGKDFHWKGRACKVYSRVGPEWKMTMHTGLLQY